MKPNNREIRIEVRLSSSEKQKLEFLAKREGLSSSALVRRLISAERRLVPEISAQRRREIHYSLGIMNQNLKKMLNDLSSFAPKTQLQFLEQFSQKVVELQQEIIKIQEQLP